MRSMKRFYAFYEMSNAAAEEFIYQLDRSELHEDYRAYSKGVRVALMALGYAEEWVNGDFRELMDSIYADDSGTCILT